MRRSLAAAVAAAALAACAQVDASKDESKYREVLEGVVPPVADVLPGDTLTVQRAMEMACGHDERLGRSGEDYVQALIDKTRAVAAFLPTLSLRPSFVVGDAPPGTGKTEGGGLGSTLVHRGDTLQALDVPAVGHANLFRGFGDVATLHATEAVIAQRRELLLDLQASVMLGTALTYYEVLRAERTVEVVAESLKLQEARLADIENAFKNGLATRLAVSQTRAQVDGVRVSLVRAQSDVRNGRSTLAFVLGVPAVNNPLVDSYAVPDDVGAEAALEHEAVEGRRDLAAARDAIVAARRNIDAAVAQYYPSVSLDVQGFLRREMYADASKWNALLAMNLPIFSAGLIDADVRTAWSRLRQAALDESLLRRTVLHDVQTSYEDLATSRRRIVDLEDQVRAAEDALTQAQDAFHAGLGINLDVLAAQNASLSANLDLTDAHFDRTIFHLTLVRVTGRLPAGVAAGPPPAGAAPPK
jgi:outer membrane protein TolC